MGRAPVSAVLLRQRPQLQPNERTEVSPIFGDVLLREPTRRQWRQAYRASLLADDTSKLDVDTWNASLFAIGVFSVDTNEPLFANAEAVLELPTNQAIWDEILRLDNLIGELSEVGQEALKSESPAADAG